MFCGRWNHLSENGKQIVDSILLDHVLSIFMRLAPLLFLFYIFSPALYGEYCANMQPSEIFSLSVNQQILFRNTHPSPSIPLVQKDNRTTNPTPLITNLDLLCGPDALHQKKADFYLELCAQFSPQDDVAWEICYLWPSRPWSIKKTFHESQLSLPLSSSHPENITILKQLTDDKGQPLSDYLNAQEASLFYESSFYLLQIQQWNRILTQRSDYLIVSYGLGLTHATLNDALLISFAKQKNTVQPSSFSHIRYSGENGLWGMQMGISLEINPCTYYQWGIKSRFGLLLRNTDFVFSLFDNNNKYLLSENSCHSTGFSFLGHIEAFWTYFFSQTFSFSWGYQGYCLSRLPFSVNQTERTFALDTKPTPLQREQSLFLNGLFVGSAFTF